MTSLEIRLNDRISNVELVRKEKNHIEIMVDGKLYTVDAVMVEDGVYSILLNGRSYTVELIEGEHAKKYNVNTLYRSFEIEIIDSETRYLLSRNKSLLGEEGNTISSPMPGKVVKITVKAGDKVEVGQTVIIVSAMKMESEYKAGKSGVIKEIHVREGDTIEGNQPLITVE
jgi:biotin carboxyl carrier protein